LLTGTDASTKPGQCRSGSQVADQNFFGDKLPLRSVKQPLDCATEKDSPVSKCLSAKLTVRRIVHGDFTAITTEVLEAESAERRTRIKRLQFRKK
jgi:hypothetical protein